MDQGKNWCLTGLLFVLIVFMLHLGVLSSSNLRKSITTRAIDIMRSVPPGASPDAVTPDTACLFKKTNGVYL